MTFIKFANFEDANGRFNSVERENSPPARLFFSRGLTQSKIFAENVAPLSASVAFLGAHCTKIISGLSPSGWKEQAPAQVKPMARNFVSLRSKAIEQKEALNARQQEWLKPAKSIDPNVAAEVRTFLRSRSASNVMELALNNPLVAGVILDFPLMSGLSADLIDRIKPTVMENNLIERFAGQNSKKPNISDILACGADYDIARSYAREAIKLHDQACNDVDDVHALLNSSIDFVAVVADVSRPAAYEMLTAA
jgi:hypothetical protein